MTKNANIERVRRRRRKRQQEASLRQQRWRVVRFAIESTKAGLYPDEDQKVIGDINSLIYKIDKYLSKPANDHQTVEKAIEKGCYILTEISDETGLPKEIIRQILKDLMVQGIIIRQSNLYRLAPEK